MQRTFQRLETFHDMRFGFSGRFSKAQVLQEARETDQTIDLQDGAATSVCSPLVSDWSWCRVLLILLFVVFQVLHSSLAGISFHRYSRTTWLSTFLPIILCLSIVSQRCSASLAFAEMCVQRTFQRREMFHDMRSRVSSRFSKAQVCQEARETYQAIDLQDGARL